MDRIGCLNAPLIITLPALRGKLLGLAAIEVNKSSSNSITCDKERRLSNILEEPSAHDFKAFFCIRRSPGRLDSPKEVFEARSCFTSTLAARLGIRRRNCGDDERLWCRFCSFGEGLSKAQISIKRTSRQTRVAIEL